MKRFKTEIEAFYALTKPIDGGCLEWTGCVEPKTGYGQARFMGRNHVAHHVALLLNGIDIVPGLQVDHLCHNIDMDCEPNGPCVHRRCVRIGHLEQKTRSQNQLDARRKERAGNAFDVRHEGHQTVQGKYQRRCLTCRRAKTAAGYNA